jgi:SAM-dependent methyltransferase
MTQSPSDGWDAGQTYDQFMGRWSRPLAIEFLRWLRPDAGLQWLDVGCGTGALSAAICRVADPAGVVGCDPSAPFVETARRYVEDPRAVFVEGGAGAPPHREGGFDAVVSGLALNFFPDPALAVREQLGALRPGGVIGAYVWDYAKGMAFLRCFWDAAIAVTSDAERLDEGKRFPICNPESLQSLFTAAGVLDVRVEAIGVPTEFSSFEDLWDPFLGGTGPAPSFVAGLGENQRQELAAELRGRLPTHASGRITLTATAWAVAGCAA